MFPTIVNIVVFDYLSCILYTYFIIFKFILKILEIPFKNLYKNEKIVKKFSRLAKIIL